MLCANCIDTYAKWFFNMAFLYPVLGAFTFIYRELNAVTPKHERFLRIVHKPT